jgi:penicillin-binding protein 1A
MPGTMKMWAASSEAPTRRSRPPTAPKSGGKTGKASKAPKDKKPKAAWRRSTWWSVVKWGTVIMLAMVALMAATIAFVFWLYGRDPNLPDIDTLRTYTPKQTTKILDTNDHRIGELGSGRRTVVAFDKIPRVVLDAFVAAEDNSFWTHGGVDYWGMARAFLSNLRAGHTTQGASTITQQVVKNMLLGGQRTFKRKIQEIILARRLEKALTKEQIIWIYLNEIDFGHNTNGIQEAARLYFGKDIGQVDAGEAALLASLPKEPEAFYRALHGGKQKDAERVKARQIYVLGKMVELKMIDAAAAQKFIDAPIKVVEEPKEDTVYAEWIELAHKQLVEMKIVPDASNEAIDNLGARVRTTLDPGLQTSAQKALQSGLRAVDARQGIGRARRHLKGDRIELELAKLAKALPAGGPAQNERYEAIVTAVHDDPSELEVDLGKWKASLALAGDDEARFNPDAKKPSERFKDGDVVEVIALHDSEKTKKHHVAFAPGPEGAVAIIEVKTRKVRALVGGYASKIGGLDRALQSKRQPGSSFKPFVYATAIDSGKYTAASRVDDAPEVFEEHPNWKPKNYESGKFEGPVLLRHALARSINTVSLRVTYDVKPESVVAMAHKLGVASKLDPEMSIALGSFEVKPIEMTNALATLAAGGITAPPQFIEAVDGKPVEAVKGEQVLRPEVAYVVLSMMQSVVTEGTGIKAAALKIPIAGKTGTSNQAKDTWFVGLTPDYAIGVWIGYDDAHPMGSKETGGGTAVPVYVDIMKTLKPQAKAFTKPAHVVEATIDRDTGLLAADGAPKNTTLVEEFVEGTQPTEVAPKPGEVTEGSSVTGEYGD